MDRLEVLASFYKNLVDYEITIFGIKSLFSMNLITFGHFIKNTHFWTFQRKKNRQQ